VNFFLAGVGITQVTRILLYRQSQKGSLEEAVKEEGLEMKETAKDATKNAEGAAKDAIKN